MGTKYSSQSISGYNSSPPADDGTVAASNQLQWQKHLDKIGAPLKTLAEGINTALVTALDQSSTSTTTTATLGASAHNQVKEIASTVSTAITLTLSDAATMAAGYITHIHNLSAVQHTLARATAGDTINGTASNVPIAPYSQIKAWVNASANGYLVEQSPGVNSSGAIIYTGTEPKAALQVVPLRDIAFYIQGLTYANNSGDATNDIDITAGVAVDATSVYAMRLASGITKQSDVAWAVGTNAGGLDTGAVGNSDYYIWLIARSDTGVVDVLFSLSSTAPTMPTSYDFKRLIGWFKRSGGAIVAFDTYETNGGGLEFTWDVPSLDIDLAATLSAARRTDAVKVPLNFSTIAHLNVQLIDAAANIFAWIYCPDQADTAPSTTAGPLYNVTVVNTTVQRGVAPMFIRTSATGTIAARCDTTTADQYRVSTMGFTWARRN